MLFRQCAIARLGLAADEEVHAVAQPGVGRFNKRHDVVARGTVFLDEAHERRSCAGERVLLPSIVLKQKRGRMGHGATLPQSAPLAKQIGL